MVVQVQDCEWPVTEGEAEYFANPQKVALGVILQILSLPLTFLTLVPSPLDNEDGFTLAEEHDRQFKKKKYVCLVACVV
jgi:hypothetical protein